MTHWLDGGGSGGGSKAVSAPAATFLEFLVPCGDSAAGWWNELWLHEAERGRRLLLVLSAMYAACNTAGADCGKSRNRLMWWRFEEAL